MKDLTGVTGGPVDRCVTGTPSLATGSRTLPRIQYGAGSVRHDGSRLFSELTIHHSSVLSYKFDE